MRSPHQGVLERLYRFSFLNIGLCIGGWPRGGVNLFLWKKNSLRSDTFFLPEKIHPTPWPIRHRTAALIFFFIDA
jgi:hypothetical protein